MLSLISSDSSNFALPLKLIPDIANLPDKTYVFLMIIIFTVLGRCI